MQNTDYVFISYAHEDRKFVESLTEIFRKEKINYWYDLEGLKAGDNIYQKITEKLLGAKALLYVVSKNSRESQSVEHELYSYSEKGIGRIIPLIIDEVGYKPIPEKLLDIQPVNFHDNFAQAAKTLVEILSEYLGLSPKPSWFFKKRTQPKLLSSFEYVIKIPDTPEKEIFGLEDFVWKNQIEWSHEILKNINTHLRNKYRGIAYAEIAQIRRGSLWTEILIYLDVGFKGLLAVYAYAALYKDFKESTPKIKEDIKKIINKKTRRYIEIKKEIPPQDVKINIENDAIEDTLKLDQTSSSNKELKTILPTTVLFLINVILIVALVVFAVRILDILEASVLSRETTYVTNSACCYPNDNISTSAIENDNNRLLITAPSIKVASDGTVTLHAILKTISNQNEIPLFLIPKKDFIVFERYQDTNTYEIESKIAKILSAEPTMIPVDIIVLMDMSGSMRDFATGENASNSSYLKSDYAKDAVLDLIHSIAKSNIASVNNVHSRIAVIPFYDEKWKPIEFNGSPWLLATNQEGIHHYDNFIGNILPHGNTPLFDAILKGIEMHSNSDNDNYKIIICITDGIENNSQITFEQLENDLSQTHVPVIMIGFEDASEKNTLEKIANISQHLNKDAASYLNLSPREVSTTLLRIAEELNAAYEIKWISGFPFPGNEVDFTLMATFTSPDGTIITSSLADTYVIPDLVP